jgi:hypothetical protein
VQSLGICQGTRLCTKYEQLGTYPQHPPTIQSCSWQQRRKPVSNAHGSLILKCLIDKGLASLSTVCDCPYLLLLPLLKRLKEGIQLNHVTAKKSKICQQLRKEKKFELRTSRRYQVNLNSLFIRVGTGLRLSLLQLPIFHSDACFFLPPAPRLTHQYQALKSKARAWPPLL